MLNRNKKLTAINEQGFFVVIIAKISYSFLTHHYKINNFKNLIIYLTRTIHIMKIKVADIYTGGV